MKWNENETMKSFIWHVLILRTFKTSTFHPRSSENFRAFVEASEHKIEDKTVRYNESQWKSTQHQGNGICKHKTEEKEVKNENEKRNNRKQTFSFSV